MQGRGGTRPWWAAVIGAVGFFLVGLAFVPGLIQRGPTQVEPPAEPPPVVRAAAASAMPAPPPAIEVAVANEAPVSSPGASFSASEGFAPDQTFDCMISANETIEIGSPIPGLLEAIEVERSDYVETGQVLAKLESTVEEAAVRVAKARADRTVDVQSTEVSLRLGKKRHSRANDLYKGDTLSLDLREEIETEAQLAELGVKRAKEDHRLAVLQLEQAEASLARRTIRSPISGFVVERLMAPGEVVDEETILTVAQIDPLRVDVILPTQLFGSVARGASFEITPEAPLDRPRVAQVSLVDRVLDGASGTFGVRLLLPNPKHDLPGGLRCHARLLPGSHVRAGADGSEVEGG